MGWRQHPLFLKNVVVQGCYPKVLYVLNLQMTLFSPSNTNFILDKIWGYYKVKIKNRLLFIKCFCAYMAFYFVVRHY